MPFPVPFGQIVFGVKLNSAPYSFHLPSIFVGRKNAGTLKNETNPIVMYPC